MSITMDHPTTGTPPAEGGPGHQLIATVEAIGADLAPGAAERDRTGEVPVDAFRRLRDEGVTAALVPADAGGGGATHAEMGAALRTLGRTDGPTAVTLSMHSHLLATQVWRHHRGMDASGVFRRVVEDRALLVSTGASDWVSSSGDVQRVEGGYRATARKAPVSGCEVGDVAVTSLRWDQSPDGPQVLHCAVPLTAEGVRIERTWDTVGMRATGSHTVVLDDVFVPDAAVSLVRPADAWPPILDTVIGAAMPLIMSAYLGIADAAVDLALDLASARTASGPAVQVAGEMLTAHTTAVDAIDAMYREARDLRFDNTDEVAARMLSRKTTATAALQQAVALAVELVGGAGYSRGHDLERLHRDVQAAAFHPLPRARQAEFTGRVGLGLSPTW
jgi:acyl-CoA dehydrogenase